MVKPNKNSNIFVGSQDYKMNFFLQFKNNVINNRLYRDSYQRHLLIIRLLIIASTIVTLFNFATLGTYFASISLVVHTTLFYKVKLKANRHMLRGMLIIISISHKLWLSQKYGVNGFFFYNIPTLLSDYMLIYEWYYHSALTTIETLLTLCLLKTNANLYFNIVFWNATISTLFFGCFERLLKENWVLYETFKKSYGAFSRLADALPQMVLVLDKKGNIDYFNEAFSFKFGMAKTGNKKHLKLRIVDYIKESDRQIFNDSFSKTIKGDKSTNVIELGKEQYEHNEVSMSLFQWKNFKSVLFISHNISANRKIITDLSQHLSVAAGQMDNIITAVESIYNSDKQLHKRLINILEKAQKIRYITDVSYIYGARGLGWQAKEAVCFDLKQMTKYFVELVANEAFEKCISIQLKFENAFPEDVSSNLKLFRSLISILLNALIEECKETSIVINGRLKQAEGNSYIVEYEFITTLPAEFTSKIGEILNSKNMSTMCLGYILAQLNAKQVIEQEVSKLKILIEIPFEMVAADSQVIINSVSMTKRIQIISKSSYVWDKSIVPPPETPESCMLNPRKIDYSKILLAPKLINTERDNKFQELLNREKKNKERNIKKASLEPNEIEKVSLTNSKAKSAKNISLYCANNINAELKDIVKKEVIDKETPVQHLSNNSTKVVSKSMVFKSSNSYEAVGSFIEEIPDEKIKGYDIN